ncbi:MAG TPA: DNA polymerase III subunit alpha, partial [Deltaproteobacteria bacterium]|nr:DNA polymerase III subunit alpha [Deltaproteobacteria bacterium]
VEAANAAEIFDLMEKFADYGFNKSHAAAYALVAYQTAYLKAHHFEEFMAANLTLDLSNTEKVSQHIAECRKRSVPVLAADINASDFEFVVTPEGIRFGLGAVKNVGRNAVEAILDERSRCGPFRDIEDFLERVPLARVNRRVVEALVKSGAFDSLHPNRRALFEALDKIFDMVQRSARSRNDAQITIFCLDEDASEHVRMPVRLPDIPDWPEADRLKMEKEGLGFYLSGHPLNRYADIVRKYVTATTATLDNAPSTLVLAGVLTGVEVSLTKKGETMAKAFLDDLDGSVRVIIFPQVYGKHQELVLSDEPVVVRARLAARQEESGGNGDTEAARGGVELVVDEIWRIT